MKLSIKEIKSRQEQFASLPDKKKLAKIIGGHLFDLRDKQNLTQADAAEILGVEPNTVSRHERGILMPTIEHLMKYAIIYNTTLDYLLKNQD